MCFFLALLLPILSVLQDFSPGYTPGYDAHMSSYYYPASGDHKHRKGDYEYRRDTYDEHEHDRWVSLTAGWWPTSRVLSLKHFLPQPDVGA